MVKQLNKEKECQDSPQSGNESNRDSLDDKGNDKIIEQPLLDSKKIKKSVKKINKPKEQQSKL